MSLLILFCTYVLSCLYPCLSFYVFPLVPQENFDEAFKHYYFATKQAPEYVLPQYGLGQMYIYKGDRTKAAECFEIVLSKQVNTFFCVASAMQLCGNKLGP